MIKKEELKKGDIICEIGHKDVVREVFVKSVGRKYIGTVPNMGNNFVTKFEYDTLDYTDGKNTWSIPHLFLGTKAEYDAYIDECKEKSELVKEIQKKIPSLSFDKLSQIKEIIEKI